jgi:hypothetical protein
VALGLVKLDARRFELQPAEPQHSSDARLKIFDDIFVPNVTYECRLAGHVETGDDSFSDPAMGGLVTLRA